MPYKDKPIVRRYYYITPIAKECGVSYQYVRSVALGRIPVKHLPRLTLDEKERITRYIKLKKSQEKCVMYCLENNIDIQ
jgi:hypothetical protein